MKNKLHEIGVSFDKLRKRDLFDEMSKSTNIIKSFHFLFANLKLFLKLGRFLRYFIELINDKKQSQKRLLMHGMSGTRAHKESNVDFSMHSPYKEDIHYLKQSHNDISLDSIKNSTEDLQNFLSTGYYFSFRFERVCTF